MARSPSGLSFPSSKVRLLKPRAPKAWGFFYTRSHRTYFSGTSMLNRIVVVALTAVFTAAALAACASAPKPATPPAPVPAPAPPLKSGLDLAGFDRSVRPQDDLYRFAGGTWLAKTPIPAGSFQLRLFHHPRRPGAGRGEAAHRGRVDAGESPHRLGRAEGRRLLSRLHGYQSSGITRAHAAQGRTGAHRRHRHAARCRALHRLFAAHRGRAAVRVVLVARQQEFVGVPGRAVSERAHDARPRLLPFSR